MSELEIKLRDLCELSNAKWAVCLVKNERWVIHAKKMDDELERNFRDYLSRSAVIDWIDSVAADGQRNVRIINKRGGLITKRLYAFPLHNNAGVTLVGADLLSLDSKIEWDEFINKLPEFLTSDQQNKVTSKEFDNDVSSHAPDALDQVLKIIIQAARSKNGWLAIRSGDHLEIKASTIDTHAERNISIDANPLIREIMGDHSYRLVEPEQLSWAMVPRICVSKDIKVWAGIPINIGKRSIGLMGLSLSEYPSEDAWSAVITLVARLSSTVEGSVVFDDLSNHLRRMSLLNDFSATISSAVDMGQIVKRLFILMKRAFNSDRIILMTHTPEKSIYHHYLMNGDAVISQTMNPTEAQPFWPVDAEMIYRINNKRGNDSIHPFYEDSVSIITVPMRIRKLTIGSLRLESNRENAFSGNDENLLAVFASHLAGFVENARLRQDAESRALNLGLIHSVVEHVINSNDVIQIAQQAADLIAKNFSYELAGIALLNENMELRLVGIGGSAASLVRSTLVGNEASHRQGVVGRVVVTGQSLIVNDVSQDPIYLPLPGWEAGSEMCVPLKDGDNILGVIDVESQKKNAFLKSDLLVLESLAGILSNVIINASQFQKLQSTVTQLQTTRLELQERIAAQKIAESKLVQAAKLAAVGEMAAGIAHELNNPLTTVAGFTELVLESLDNKSNRQDLELVLREAQRARGVVRRLLDFARQTESIRTRCDVNEIIDDVINLTRHLLQTSGILLSLELEKDLHMLYVDRNQIKQVFLNLIHNSMHAMPAGGKLTITSENGNQGGKAGIVVSITDTGIGIPPDQLQRIFEPFFTTRSKEGGTGLGLSVSYGIVVDHGGVITVTSSVGEGSTFKVWVPVEVA